MQLNQLHSFLVLISSQGVAPGGVSYLQRSSKGWDPITSPGGPCSLGQLTTFTPNITLIKYWKQKVNWVIREDHVKNSMEIAIAKLTTGLKEGPGLHLFTAGGLS